MEWGRESSNYKTEDDRYRETVRVFLDIKENIGFTLQDDGNNWKQNCSEVTECKEKDIIVTAKAANATTTALGSVCLESQQSRSFDSLPRNDVQPKNIETATVSQQAAVNILALFRILAHMRQYGASSRLCSPLQLTTKTLKSKKVMGNLLENKQSNELNEFQKLTEKGLKTVSRQEFIIYRVASLRLMGSYTA
ncbi:hypothetical protein Tco_0599552 [Tanacetum coccineum]